MIIKQNVQVTKKDIEDEIEGYEELLYTCYELGLDGIIKTIKGRTEYIYIDDLKNWIEEDKFLINNEDEEE